MLKGYEISRYQCAFHFSSIFDAFPGSAILMLGEVPEQPQYLKVSLLRFGITGMRCTEIGAAMMNIRAISLLRHDETLATFRRQLHTSSIENTRAFYFIFADSDILRLRH